MTHHYGPRLKMLHNCTDQAITNSLAEMELTAAQGHIMAFLAHQPQPPCPRDIEEVFHASHPTVSGLLRRLEKKAFIELRPDPADKRCKRIYVLPKGDACIQRMHASIEATECKLVDGFTPQEQEVFLRLLDRAIQNMGGQQCRPFHKEDP